MSVVLIVDDEPALCELLRRWLVDEGFEVYTASGAIAAIAQARERVPAVVITDVNMPTHDGVWLSDRIRHLHPTAAIIVLTAMGAVDTAVRSLKVGVQDFLVKPVEREALLASVVHALDWHRAEAERLRVYRSLEDEVRTRRVQLDEAVSSLRITSEAAIDALLRLLTLHDAPAYDHATRVAKMATRLATWLGVDDRVATQVRIGALLHDLGKMAVGVRVLTKPDRLSEVERELIARHPQLGADIVSHVPFMTAAAEIVAAHHERWDRAGYPNQLLAAEIPLGARIVMVADTFDALTNDRPYQGVVSPASALAEITRCRGTQFDPEVVDAFTAMLAAEGTA